MSEFNEYETENFDSVKQEFNADPTTNVVKANPDASEFFPSVDNEIAARRKGKKAATIFTAAVFSVACLGVLGSGAAYATTEANNVSAQALSLWASESEIGYDIVLSEAPENVTIAIFNDFTFREARISEKSASGKIGGLLPGHTYTLEVRAGNDVGYSVVLSRKVRTRGDP